MNKFGGKIQLTRSVDKIGGKVHSKSSLLASNSKKFSLKKWKALLPPAYRLSQREVETTLSQLPTSPAQQTFQSQLVSPP